MGERVSGVGLGLGVSGVGVGGMPGRKKLWGSFVKKTWYRLSFKPEDPDRHLKHLKAGYGLDKGSWKHPLPPPPPHTPKN